MRRRRYNRKVVQRGPVFPTSVAFVLTLVTILAFAYLWLGNRCDVLGQRILSLEALAEELQRQILCEESKWSQLKSPQNIERLIAQFDLQLVWPGERYTVRVRRPELEPTAPANSLYAQYPAHRHD